MRTEMRTDKEIENARMMVCNCLSLQGLSDQQMEVLTGMSVALNWVAGTVNGVTLQRIINGEEIVKRKDQTHAD